VFSAGSNVTGTYSVTLDGTQAITGIRFEEGNVTITGGTELTLATSAPANPGDFNGDGIVDAADYVLLQKTGGSQAVFAQHFGESGGAGSAGVINVAAANATIDSVIGGVGARLTKSGAGTLTLNGFNTYDGGTTVAGGKLSFAGETGGALGAVPGAVDPDNIILSGGGILSSTEDATETAMLFPTRGVTIGAGGGGLEVAAATASLNLLSELAGSEKWTKSGPGTLALGDTTNPFTGGFRVTEGKLVHSTFESAAPAPGTLRASGVEPADVVPDYVILDGGTIEYNNTGAGSTMLSNRKGITLTANGGGLSLPGVAGDPVANTSITNYFGKVSAADGAILYKRGHGEIRPNKQVGTDDGGWDHTKLVVEEGLYRVGNLGEEGLFGKVPVSFMADAIRLSGQGTTRVDGAAAIGLTSGATHNLVTTTPATRGITIDANGGTICTSLGIGSWVIESIISGPGALNINGNGFPVTGAGDFATATSTLVFEGANTYAGGTSVNSGILVLDGAAATLGTGNVTVDGVTVGINGATEVAAGQMKILSGVGDAISNSAMLSLTGGGTANLADRGYVELGAGINETVNQLVLGGVGQAPGTYGSTSSTATFQFDEYFSGTGIVTVISAGASGSGAVPEPSAAVLLMLGLAGLWVRRGR
jgi:autotransporter-associated beta strand protein